ncbi:3-hydroxyacyl-CoA dehydrogenase family protein [Priestia megaterium]
MQKKPFSFMKMDTQILKILIRFAKALNHPIGPFELMDLSGIDVGYFVMQQRYSETGIQRTSQLRVLKKKFKRRAWT